MKKILTLLILFIGLSLTYASEGENILSNAANWRFFGGTEFAPGAKGTFAIHQENDSPLATLTFDYSEGGLYVTGVGDIKVEGAQELRFKAKSDHRVSVGIRLIDKTGQAHQSLFQYTGDGEWQEFRVSLDEVAGMSFGGANDKTLHFPVTQIRLFTQKKGEATKGTVLFKDVRFR